MTRLVLRKLHKGLLITSETIAPSVGGVSCGALTHPLHASRHGDPDPTLRVLAALETEESACERERMVGYLTKQDKKSNNLFTKPLLYYIIVSYRKVNLLSIAIIN